MIKFLPFDFLGVSHRIQWKNKNTVYHLQISALVLEIFKFEKCVKYANERPDDVIHPTQFYIKYINRAISVNLQPRPLNKDLSDERLGAKLRVTENRWVIINFLTYGYLALLPQHWALYAKVDSIFTFIYIWDRSFCLHKLIKLWMWNTISQCSACFTLAHQSP
mgnify:CR=1 FL=1